MVARKKPVWNGNVIPGDAVCQSDPSDHFLSLFPVIHAIAVFISMLGGGVGKSETANTPPSPPPLPP